MTVKESQQRILEGLRQLQKDKLDEAKAAKKQQKHKARYSAVMFFGLLSIHSPAVAILFFALPASAFFYSRWLQSDANLSASKTVP